MLALGEPLRRVREPAERPSERPCEEHRGARGEQEPEDAGDDQPSEERAGRRGVEPLRPEQHERLLRDGTRRVVGPLADALEAAAVAQLALLARVEVLRRAVQRRRDDALVLHLERLLQRAEPSEREQRGPLALGEHVRAVAEVAKRRTLDLTPGELEPDRERHADREDNRQSDRGDETRAEGSQRPRAL